MTENPNDNPISTFKLIDKDHPELFWTVETTKVSSERFYFDYNFEDIIKGWFSIVPKYIFKKKPKKEVFYAALYYTREQAEARKVDTNFAVVELIWEKIT